jgi:tellurite resistance protein
MRRWFTLFFIPLFPIGAVKAEYVECITCKQTYKLAVLSAPTVASLQGDLGVAMRQAVVTLLRSTDTAAARAAAQDAVALFTEDPWTDEQLAGDLASLDTADLTDRLSRLSATLNEQGKERFLAAAVRVASTGGVIDGESEAALERLAGSLSMTAAHTRGVIDQVLREARA